MGPTGKRKSQSGVCALGVQAASGRALGARRPRSWLFSALGGSWFEVQAETESHCLTWVVCPPLALGAERHRD